MATNGTIPKTMKAQQINCKDLTINLNEIPVPTPREDQLLVKILCASLCHSDIMIFEPNESLQRSEKSITMGHEATGTIVGMGSAITGFKAGDNVGFIPGQNVCYECHACRNVHNLWCEKGQPLMNGFAIDGFFAEYAVVEARQAMVIPDGLDPVAAAPLFCAGVTAHHAINDLELPEGSWVAIIGCGGLGLLAVQYAKAMGYRVIGIDMSSAALDEAKTSGAEHVFNPASDKTYVDEILKITGQGVDAAVNFTASKRAYDAMPSIIRPARGIFMAVGIPKEPLEINAYDIALGRYRVMGSNNGTCYNMPDAINFSAKHNVLSKIEYYPLEDLPVMVKKMQDHKATGRMAVKF